MTEIWTKWEPIEGLSNRYNLDCLQDDDAGLIIILSDYENTHKKIRIFREYSVSAYQKTSTTILQLIVDDLEKHYGKDFSREWAFFKVTNSNYLQWLSEQSWTISDDMNLTHFVILTTDSMIDIIHNFAPDIEMITQDLEK